MNTKDKKIAKFSKLALKEIKLVEMVESWNFKQLGDFLIQRIWATKFDKIGTLESVVLDRVINELFIAHEQDAIHKVTIEDYKKAGFRFENDKS